MCVTNPNKRNYHSIKEHRFANMHCYLLFQLIQSLSALVTCGIVSLSCSPSHVCPLTKSKLGQEQAMRKKIKFSNSITSFSPSRASPVFGKLY